jgi:hypothetical protein
MGVIKNTMDNLSGAASANFRATIEAAKADGHIDKAEFQKICAACNDTWKLNRIGVMSWLRDADPALHNALSKGQAAMSAEVGWNNYANATNNE